MLKILFICFGALVLLTALAVAQEIDITFTPEGIQTATQNTELLLSDPSINQTTFYQSPAAEEKKKETAGSTPAGVGAGALSAGVESEVSGPNKSISIPLQYTYRAFTLGVSLPYVYQRKMHYTLATKQTSGVGDVTLNLGYTKAFNGLMFNASIFSKLPTGDATKAVDGYLVPLGTGSLDWALNLSLLKLYQRCSISSSASLRLNGSADKTAEIVRTDDPDGNSSTTDIETIKYDIQNGNMFTFTGGFDYFLSSNWTLGAVAALTLVSEGSTDATHTYSWGATPSTVSGISNQQDMTLVDFVPMLSYYLWAADLTVMAKIPVFTQRSENNQEEARGVTVLFKLSRKL